MKSLLCVAAAALLCACSGSSEGSPPASSPSPLACNLPIGAYVGDTDKGGWLSLPSGAFASDPNSEVVWDGQRGLRHTVQEPVLYGDGGLTYDGAARRWLPVSGDQVLPDGSAYVYTEESTDRINRTDLIHVVQVSSGADTLVIQGDYQAIAYRPQGILLISMTFREGSGLGLWLLDPTTQRLHMFTDAGRWLYGGGAAWSVQGGGDPYSVSLLRLDLDTGAVVTWMTVPATPPAQQLGAQPSPSFQLLGFDVQMHPLVLLASAEAPNIALSAWLLTAPGASVRLNPPPPVFSGTGVTDEHGLWISNSDGIYLYRGSGFAKVAAAPFTGGSYWIAGNCS